MTIPQALQHLFYHNPVFAEKIKTHHNTSTRYKIYLKRFERGELGAGAAVGMLEEFGYVVRVELPDLAENGQ